MKLKKIKELAKLFFIITVVAGSFASLGYAKRGEEVKEVVVYKEAETIIESPEDTIIRVCKEEGVPYITCLRVAICESNFDQFFSKDIKGIGRDRGIFSINSVHYKQVSDECAFSVSCSAKVFAEQYKAGKAGDWLCYNQIFGKK